MRSVIAMTTVCRGMALHWCYENRETNDVLNLVGACCVKGSYKL